MRGRGEESEEKSGLKDRVSVLTSQVDQLTNTVKELLAEKRMSRKRELSIEPISLENSSLLTLEEVYEFIEPLFN